MEILLASAPDDALKSRSREQTAPAVEAVEAAVAAVAAVAAAASKATI